MYSPSGSLEALRARARILAFIRRFFEDRGVLEVETPVLCAAGAVDEHLEPIRATARGADGAPRTLYLVTSPEHSMKRLLAAGSGPIYQITRAFRDADRGRLHNPEFTILEWYRPGWSHVDLMAEVEDLVRRILLEAIEEAPQPLRLLAREPFERVTYREAFQRSLGIDPFRDPVAALAEAALRLGVSTGLGRDEAHRDDWLNLLMALSVEKNLGCRRPAFLLDYPPSQAALARVRLGDPSVAERFELYIQGIELANGYHELLDPREQEARFLEANRRREATGRPPLPVDRSFLDALEAGVPPCAGVAVGLDRAIMMAVGARSIDEVMAFPFEKA